MLAFGWATANPPKAAPQHGKQDANLVKQYRDFRALDRISMCIGAGKTMHTRILTGLVPPTLGEVTAGGINVAKEPERAGRHVGYLPRNFGFDKGRNALSYWITSPS